MGNGNDDFLLHAKKVTDEIRDFLAQAVPGYKIEAQYRIDRIILDGLALSFSLGISFALKKAIGASLHPLPTARKEAQTHEVFKQG